MSFVPVNVNLDRPYAPPLLDGIGESLKIFYRGVFLDDCHSLSEGAASFTDSSSSILVLILNILFLHRPTGQILHHAPLPIIVFLKAFPVHDG